MSRKLISEERQAVAEIIKATDAFAKSADHLDAGIIELEASINGAIALLPGLDELIAQDVGSPREQVEKSKHWVATLRHDLFQIKDNARLLRKMQNNVSKNLRSIGADIFDPRSAWDSIRVEVGATLKQMQALVSETHKLDERVTALKKRTAGMVKQAEAQMKASKKSASKRIA